MGETSIREAIEMADEIASIGDEARLIELMLCGCAYIASNEGMEDGRPLHVAEGIVHGMIERLEALRSRLEAMSADEASE